MQYVIILALLYFLFSSSSKKKKRAQQQGRQSEAERRIKPAQPAPEPPEPAEEEPEEEVTAQGADAKTLTPEEWEAYLEAKAEKSAAEQAEAPVRPQESDVHAQSLPVSAPEGETRAEHAAHNERVHAREQAERQYAEDARARRYANRQRLREAVIMREILDKPVSMRRNRTI